MPAPGLLAAAPILLHILTFNIWGLPDAGFRVISPLRKDRIQAICRELQRKSAEPNGWDVVILQEAWTPDARETLKNCGYLHTVNREDPKRLLDSGLMILSKYPLERVARLTYPANGNMDQVLQDGEALARKSALIARVAHPRAPFWIADTHLISFYSTTHDQYSGARRQQFIQFSNWAKAIAGAEPLIVGGDFNFGPDNPLWNEVPQIFPNFRQAPGADEQCTLCPPNMMHTQNEGKVDHLFASPQLNPVSGKTAMTATFRTENLTVYPSDHFGWETTFQVH